jgi:hypothetical protein
MSKCGPEYHGVCGFATLILDFGELRYFHFRTLLRGGFQAEDEIALFVRMLVDQVPFNTCLIVLAIGADGIDYRLFRR